jgi:hypothetical protein
LQMKIPVITGNAFRVKGNIMFFDKCSPGHYAAH